MHQILPEDANVRALANIGVGDEMAAPDIARLHELVIRSSADQNRRVGLLVAIAHSFGNLSMDGRDAGDGRSFVANSVSVFECQVLPMEFFRTGLMAKTRIELCGPDRIRAQGPRSVRQRPCSDPE